MAEQGITIAICLPMRDFPSAHFCLSLAAVTYVTRTRLMICRGHSSLSAAKCRNIVLEKLVTMEAMTQRRADWTVWFDDDMVFPGDTIARLLSHGKPIIGASYLRRTPPHDLLGLPKGSRVQTSGLAEFLRLPAGCLLVRRDVFDKVGKWRVGDDETGEDALFCDAAHAAGYEVWCDLDLTREIKHVSEQLLEVDPEKSVLVLPSKVQPAVPALIGVRGNGRG